MLVLVCILYVYHDTIISCLIFPLSEIFMFHMKLVSLLLYTKSGWQHSPCLIVIDSLNDYKYSCWLDCRKKLSIHTNGGRPSRTGYDLAYNGEQDFGTMNS